MAIARATRPIASQRLGVIADLVARNGGVRASELAQLLGVTDETVRRDLGRLASMGVLEKVYGGAVAVRPLTETTYQGRLLEARSEKTAIGAMAAELVQDGDSIILDGGTTTLCLARALRGKRELVVATNGVPHAAEIVRHPHVMLILIGGIVRSSTLGAVGDAATAALKELHVRRTFLAAHSVSTKSGVTDPRPEEVAIKRAMIEAASEVVLLADHTKFGRESLMKVVPLTSIHRVITSEGVDANELDAIRSLGITVTVVSVPPNEVDTAAWDRPDEKVLADGLLE